MTEQHVNKLLIPRDAMRTVFLEMIFSPKGPDAEITDEDAVIRGKGTGFLYRDRGKVFVITARHNLTGRNWETNEFMNQDGYPVEPTHIRITMRRKVTSSSEEIIFIGQPGTTSVEIPLGMHVAALIDESWKPTWLEHPENRAAVDVAAIPFPDDGTMQMLPWEEKDVGEDEYSKLAITQDLSIAGYPFGLVSGPALPLWIRGSIASEPSLYYTHNGRNIPAFLIDARTRKGQSGSPVMLFRLPATIVAGPDGIPKLTTGFNSRLLGVYTGRIANESDLGFVWRMEEALKVCRGVKPDYPFKPLPRIASDPPNVFGSIRNATPTKT
jgi:hypothetical protein